MRTKAYKVGLLLGALSVTGLIGCASDGAENALDTCSDGTCDDWNPFDRMLDLLRVDKASVPIAKLMDVGRAPFEQIACNDIGARVVVDDVNVYDQSNMASVVSQMAAALGNDELTTEVQAARLAQLQSPGSAPEYVEADASLGLDISPDFSIKTGGFGDEDLNLRFGFSAEAEVGYRFVFNMEDGRSGFVDRKIAPDTLENMCDSDRGFLVPRGLDDLRKMKVGELAALHGRGALGTNAGMSAPILLTTSGPFTVHAVLRAGRSTMLEGDIDTQVVRMPNNEVVLDVGIQDAEVKRRYLQLQDDWGVLGFCGEIGIDCDTKILGKSLDELVDDVVEKALDRKLNLFNAEYRRRSGPYRMSVARIRLNLDAIESQAFVNQEGISSRDAADVAVNQAMVGDLRLLEALVFREDPGITVEWDLLQSGHHAASSFGFELFGIELWGRTFSEGNASTVLQTADTIDAMFSTKLEENSGAGKRRGYSRIGVGALHFDKASETLTAATNLIVQVMHSGQLKAGDITDQLDGTMRMVAGADAYDLIEDAANIVRRDIGRTCDEFVDEHDGPVTGTHIERSEPYQAECSAMMFDDEIVNDDNRSNLDIMTTRYLNAVDAVVRATDGMPEDRAELISAAAQVRFASNACYYAQVNGAKGAVVSDFRFDEATLNRIMQQGAEEDFAASIKEYLKVADVEPKYRESLDSQRAKIDDENYRDGTIENVVDAYRAAAQEYRITSEAEQAAASLFGAQATQISLSGTDRDAEIDGRNPIQEAVATSMAAGRARAAAKLFDRVRDEADRSFIFGGDLGPKAEFTVAYALLGMAERDHQDVRVHLSVDDSNEDFELCREQLMSISEGLYGGRSFDLAAQGASAERIKFGSFAVDPLVGLCDEDDAGNSVGQCQLSTN